jgi:hypothetical protein
MSRCEACCRPEKNARVRLREGRWFGAGQREIVVGKSVAKRYRCSHRQHLHFGRGDWKIVGVMGGGQSAINSEMWRDLNQVTSDYNRRQGRIAPILGAIRGFFPARSPAKKDILAAMPGR